MKVAIVGGGWAGLSAAVSACQAGHEVCLFEAASTLGGRARALPIDTPLPNATSARLDNGQHILIGAYTETLRLMRLLGVDDKQVLLRQPLSLPLPDGTGLQTPSWAGNWPAPVDALLAMVLARGWGWQDKLSLLKTCVAWQLAGFACAQTETVSDLCRGLSGRVMAELIEPLCVSALNTPACEASGAVFLRVLKDALFGVRGGSHLLLPRTDLGQLLPQAAVRWLTSQGAGVHTGMRVQPLAWASPHWIVNGEPYDRVVWATGASEAHRAMTGAAASLGTSTATERGQVANSLQKWAAVAEKLQYKTIATVYVWAPGVRLHRPMLALHSHAAAPAQFVFDRGQLDGTTGLLAFVVSASVDDRETLQAAVLKQASNQLGLQNLQALQTIVEKRATFACTPTLVRPGQDIAPGLLAAGDYVQGPYPATLEGAVRSGWSAGLQLQH